MPARRKRRHSSLRGPGGRTRRTGRRRRIRVSGAALEQRHLDLIGLAAIALGAYLMLVLYFGWRGGSVGSGARVGLDYLFGQISHVVPVVFIAGGVVLILRPFLPSVRVMRTGAICVLSGLLLAFAAQTASIGPDHPLRHGYFNPGWFPHHGGLIGEALYWSSATLFQRAGANIIALLLLLSGTLLLSGISIASALRGLGRLVRRAGTGGGEVARTLIHTERQEAPTNVFETQVSPTDVMSHYPDEEFEPSVSVLGGEDAPEQEPVQELGGEASAAFEELGQGDEATTPAQPAGGGEVARTPMGERRGVTTAEAIDYKPPSPRLLEKGSDEGGPDPHDYEAVGRKLVEALGHFGVEARVVGIVSGPHVSRYELRLAPGTKVKKVSELSSDLAYALASTDIRILAPIPGKQAVGVEIPNPRRRLVRLGDIYQSRPPRTSPLVGWLGKDIAGSAVWTDLAKMPHVLVAGTTGSGKSGCLNAILCSILMQASPNDVRMVLVDPKRVELNHYEAVPHLLTPVVTSPRLAANVLSNLIGEMESRYEVMGEARARNLAELNAVRARGGEPHLPHILFVVDELADLMMISPAEVEDSIIRLAQKSRATGIHLVLATQRPSTDIITGTIKVNIPARIAFAVSSQTDSRVILDHGGAEALLGQGDMLFRAPGTSKLQRIQGAFVSEEEIARVTTHWARQGRPEFEHELLETRPDSEQSTEEGEFDPDRDALLDQAIRLVVETQTASVSMIQRRLRVGYTRAGRLIDMLERRGVISGYEGSKPRAVLIGEGDLSRVLGTNAQAESDPGNPEPVSSSREP